jgi:hypothetical protein
MSQRAHLVGSVGLGDAETVFNTVSEILGPICPRIPDGETGERSYWIRWQRERFASNPGLELAAINPSTAGIEDRFDRTLFRIKNGVKPKSLEFGPLGYAREALKSYRVFARLMEEGRIASNVRFQVSLPTPIALLSGFVVFEDRLRMEPAIEVAMLEELDQIQGAIPASHLCIQWDVAFEVIGAAGGPLLPYLEAVAGSVQRIGRGRVMGGVELGIHLCYGDPGHKHIIEPWDLSIAVAFANGITRASPRVLDFIHMPVPRDRSDDAYFLPLQNLQLASATRLILGLVHYTDGVEGSRKRMAVAARYTKDFDMATECGFGRRDPATIPDLLRIHRELCDSRDDPGGCAGLTGRFQSSIVDLRRH